MDTDALISELSGGAAPVRRLRSPWQRTALWLALGIPPLVLVIAVHGLDVDLRTMLADRQFLIEQLATLATALTAALAAFASTVPGGSRRWYWLPLFPLTVWLFTVGKGCIDDWSRLGAEALSLRLDDGCFLPMVLIGIVPAVAMLRMLRRGAPLSPRLTLVLGALATAAIVAFALRFFHVGDVSFMILVWHFGLMGTVALVACLVGPRVLAWRHSLRSRSAIA